MTSVTRSNAQGTGGAMSKTTFQRRMHKVMKIAGYEFTRHDARGHNTYVNAHGQYIGIPGTPRNDGRAAVTIKAEITRNKREREANEVSTPTMSQADVYLAMADKFLMTEATDSRGRKARIQALEGWCKRVLERHGPVVAGDLIEAAERMGFPRIVLQKARTRIGAVTFNAGGTDKSKTWRVCLPEQVPEHKRARINPAAREFEGEIEKPEPAPDFASYLDREQAKTETNGKHEPTDQQAAFLLLAETMGLELPKTKDTTEALESLRYAAEQLLKAQEAIADAVKQLS